MGDENQISIWFFIGSLLTLYGIIIFIASLQPITGSHVVLARLHAGIWWGILLFLLGVMYVTLFRPGRMKRKQSEDDEAKGE